MKTKLLLVIIDFNGGTATYCRTLAAALRRYFPDEFELSLLLMRNRGLEDQDREIFHEIHTGRSRVANDLRRYYQTPLDALALKGMIQRICPDLILTVGTYAGLLAPLAAGGRPVVLTAHHHASTQLREGRFGRVIGALMRWRFPRFPVIVPAGGLADDLRDRFGVRDITVIPHGIDAEAVRALAEQAPDDLPPAGSYLVACGRLSAEKDYPGMLRAYAIARAQGLREPLLILGDGPERSDLEALSRQMGLGSAVGFLGHRANPFPYLKNARCLVLSSVAEGFGLVLLEAMALGVPVISTDCPGGPAEVLGGGEYGLLVPPGRPDALADDMLRLATSEPLHRQFSQRAAERAQQLSLADMASRYRERLLAVLARPPA